MFARTRNIMTPAVWRSMATRRVMFSSQQKASNVGAKNAATAAVIAGFVGVVYYTAINKMREDDLGNLIREKEDEKSH